MSDEGQREGGGGSRHDAVKVQLGSHDVVPGADLLHCVDNRRRQARGKAEDGGAMGGAAATSGRNRRITQQVMRRLIEKMRERPSLHHRWSSANCIVKARWSDQAAAP